MRTSSNGIALIHSFEKCRLKAYLDGAGVWTIGWGNTYYADNTKVKKGDVITQAEADALFEIVLPKYEAIVNKLIKVPMLQQEFDAYVSFCYNTGGHYLSKKLRKYVPFAILATYGKVSKQHTYNSWLTTATTGGGKKMAGLVKRRLAEAELFLSGKLMLHK